jgi:osmotically-inducible protein OsmY
MKSVLTLIAVAFTALVSNAVQAEGSSSTQPQQKPGATAQPPGASGQAQPPDNTGRNESDRQGGRLDAGDQSNNEQDVALTAKIRRAITDTSGLSVNARNIKIITSGGKVTLRGPVDSEAERTRVETIAKQAAGQQRSVVNELEVKKQ